MTNKSYITIQGWMRTELNLKGNDLLVYAIIYGFSQTDGQRFTGSLQYLADWCGATKQGIQKNLKNLLDAGLINKYESVKNGVKICEYSCGGYTTELHGGIQLSCINNINNTTNTNSINTIREFKFGKKLDSKKDNLYTKCIGLIDAKTDDVVVRELLVDWFNMLLEKYRSRGKQAYANVIKGKLNMLDKFARSDWEDIIKYAIQRGYEGFYPIPISGGRRINEGIDVVSDTYTEEELEELNELDKQRERKGMRTRF